MFGLGGGDGELVAGVGLRIGFVGKGGSGKTTAARMVCEGRKPSGVTSFADPIRAMLALLYGHNPEMPVNKGLYRSIMQQIGEKLREVDKEICVNVLVSNVLAASPSTTICVDDVRYPNEAAALRKCGFTIVRLIREGVGLEGDAARHPSEVNQDAIVVDYTIKATTLKELKEGLSQVLKELGAREVEAA